MNLDKVITQASDNFRNFHYPDNVEVLKENFELITLSLDTEYILEIAKTKQAGDKLQKSRDFLLSYQGQLGQIQIPYPKYYLQSEECPFGVIGYRGLPGDPLEVELLPPIQSTRLANEISNFLVDLHHISPEMLQHSFQLFPPPPTRIRSISEKVIHHLSNHIQNDVIKHLKEVITEMTTFFEQRYFEPKITHSNFTSNNILVDHETSQLFGVMGFADITIGDPMVDLASLYLENSEFGKMVNNNYKASEPDQYHEFSKFGFFLQSWRIIQKIHYQINNVTLDEIQTMELIQLLEEYKNDYRE